MCGDTGQIPVSLQTGWFVSDTILWNRMSRFTLTQNIQGERHTYRIPSGHVWELNLLCSNLKLSDKLLVGVRELSVSKH